MTITFQNYIDIIAGNRDAEDGYRLQASVHYSHSMFHAYTLTNANTSTTINDMIGDLNLDTSDPEWNTWFGLIAGKGEASSATLQHYLMLLEARDNVGNPLTFTVDGAAASPTDWFRHVVGMPAEVKTK